MTDVVAALIWDGDKFMICQRPPHKARGLLWEFVGGKVEPGETKQQALIRECREELAVAVTVKDVFLEVIHTYPDIVIRLTLFNAVISAGIPQMLEHNAIAWITPKQISQYAFCPADKEILELIQLRSDLFSLCDETYKQFQGSLLPTVQPDRMIGVRMPALRKLAKHVNAESFMTHLPHKYYEEDMLHGILISSLTDANTAIEALNAFLPYVDNWAVCDTISPKAFTAHPAYLLDKVKQWLRSDHPYTVRYAIGVLMKYYLDDAFTPPMLDFVVDVKSADYYVNMMRSWFFATALAKQYKSTVRILEENKLDTWTHNKTIQKAVESFRITREQKNFLRTLRK